MSEQDEKRHLMYGTPTVSYRTLSPSESSIASDNAVNLLNHDIDSSSLEVNTVTAHSINYVPHKDCQSSEDDDDDNKNYEVGSDGGNTFDSCSSISQAAYTIDESGQFEGIGSSSILQAVVFLEDAYYYRSINHKLEPSTLQIYRQYKSTTVNVYRCFIIFALHMLAFFEYPSSLTVTSDLRTQGERIEVPCWLTQALEMLCLLSLLMDNIIKMYLMSPRYFVKHKWDVLSMVIVCLSFVDWTVSLGFSCHEYFRFRRMFRPFFILQHSSLMKKIVNCLRRTVPEVVSVLLLLFFHLFIFTLFGMLLFPEFKGSSIKNSTAGLSGGSGVQDIKPASNTTGSSDSSHYFENFLDSLIDLLVLLTTANNPDVTLPAYSKNRLASLFFVVYLLIGLYCFMNMLLAVIYNQFRGYFRSSMQRDLLRRRLGVRASFEVLRRRERVLANSALTAHGFIGIGVGGHVIKVVVEKSLLPKYVKEAICQGLQGRFNRMLNSQQYQQLFYCLDKEFVHEQLPGIPWCHHPNWRRIQKVFLHHYFTYFGIFISFINLVIIAVPLMAKKGSRIRGNHTFLQAVNFTFIFYYLIEQLVKLWAYGWRRYVRDKANVFDAVVTITLIIGEIYLACVYGLPYFSESVIVEDEHHHSLFNIIRVVNIFIMVRIMKIIPHIKAMSLVVTVVLDLMKNMKAFAGILVVIFYAFGILGMELFHNTIVYEPGFVNKTFECGTYEQLDYWANNFDDFFASLIILWDVMVVNNWQVFLYVFKDKTSPWSYLFFVVWWIMAVIIIMNLFTALIMENFIMKWDRRDQETTPPSDLSEDLTVSVYLNNDVHTMFRDSLQEPADNDLLLLLREHRYLLLDR